MPEPLRIVLAGAPERAMTCLEALPSSPHRVVAVDTQGDRAQGGVGGWPPRHGPDGGRAFSEPRFPVGCNRHSDTPKIAVDGQE